MLSFKPASHSPRSPSSRGSLVPLHFLPLKHWKLKLGVSLKKERKKPGSALSNQGDHSTQFSHSLMSIKSVMPSNHLILCHPLLPPPIFPSIRVFSSESVLHIRWSKYWSLSFSISSVWFSLSVLSDSFRPHELQHARPPCPSPTPGVHSNSRPLSQ